ncbi:unnamed protein product [Parnassius apollo]|uniref:(apollo) hypothetical protein n=1 Tax=Parnassius apollo TaxID=110799 RepID=A0A8S3WGZ6_PARAO|nr:unnamed protein product [Parnassius apollo]
MWHDIYRVIRKSNKNLEDTLLRKTPNGTIKTPAESADLLSETFYPTDEIENELNPILNHMWGKLRKMKLAAHKTLAIVVTKKRKFENRKLTLDNIEIKFTDSVTILGLTIDVNLNFIKHVDRTSEKSIQLYKKVARAARANWGLITEILRTIYITVVEPTVLYAAGAWGSVADKK